MTLYSFCLGLKVFCKISFIYPNYHTTFMPSGGMYQIWSMSVLQLTWAHTLQCTGSLDHQYLCTQVAIFVELRQGSGKDRQGMAKGERP